jgi:hypothetical protein
MLNLDDSGSVNKPLLIQRKDIIATILDIIQGAWIHVCKRGDVTSNCDEPTIAGALYHEMLNEKDRRGISSERSIIVNESAERKSESSLKPNGFIDFKMFYEWGERYYFGIECKRISSIKTGKDKDLATEYVTNGIMRFSKGIYSSGHDFAAMLGFVIDGKVNDCVTRICTRINKYSTEINLEEHWEKEERFGKHSHLYRTSHRQVDHNNNLITILHLFVDFNPL